jgi:threonine aldolase
MLLAMMDAPVGDDTLGEDPTVRRLEREAAEALGKDAALISASGAMANLLAIAAQCARGAAVVCGEVASAKWTGPGPDTFDQVMGLVREGSAHSACPVRYVTPLRTTERSTPA